MACRRSRSAASRRRLPNRTGRDVTYCLDGHFRLRVPATGSGGNVRVLSGLRAGICGRYAVRGGRIPRTARGRHTGRPRHRRQTRLRSHRTRHRIQTGDHRPQHRSRHRSHHISHWSENACEGHGDGGESTGHRGERAGQRSQHPTCRDGQRGSHMPRQPPHRTRDRPRRHTHIPDHRLRRPHHTCDHGSEPVGGPTVSGMSLLVRALGHRSNHTAQQATAMGSRLHIGGRLAHRPVQALRLRGRRGPVGEAGAVALGRAGRGGTTGGHRRLGRLLSPQQRPDRPTHTRQQTTVGCGLASLSVRGGVGGVHGRRRVVGGLRGSRSEQARSGETRGQTGHGQRPAQHTPTETDRVRLPLTPAHRYPHPPCLPEPLPLVGLSHIDPQPLPHPDWPTEQKSPTRRSTR